MILFHPVYKSHKFMDLVTINHKDRTLLCKHYLLCLINPTHIWDKNSLRIFLHTLQSTPMQGGKCQIPTMNLDTVCLLALGKDHTIFPKTILGQGAQCLQVCKSSMLSLPFYPLGQPCLHPCFHKLHRCVHFQLGVDAQPSNLHSLQETMG